MTTSSDPRRKRFCCRRRAFASPRRTRFARRARVERPCSTFVLAATTSPCCSASGAATPTRAEAVARGETYTFTDAWGDAAHLAEGRARLPGPERGGPPSFALQPQARPRRGSRSQRRAAGRAAARCSFPTPRTCAETIARIEAGCARPAVAVSIVTGKTNLPPRLLGLRPRDAPSVTGYTGWRWLPGSPFAGDAWEKLVRQRLSRPPRPAGRAGTAAAACSPTWSSSPAI